MNLEKTNLGRILRAALEKYLRDCHNLVAPKNALERRMQSMRAGLWAQCLRHTIHNNTLLSTSNSYLSFTIDNLCKKLTNKKNWTDVLVPKPDSMMIRYYPEIQTWCQELSSPGSNMEISFTMKPESEELSPETKESEEDEDIEAMSIAVSRLIASVKAASHSVSDVDYKNKCIEKRANSKALGIERIYEEI